MTPTRILLIEDDAGITDTLSRLLAGEGCELVVERRGDAGLVRAQAEAFDVLVTDLKVPGTNGLEIVRQLHAIQPRLPIILATAFGTTDTAIEAMKWGAYDYLLKPFDPPRLLELIRKAADSHRRLSEPVALGEPAASREALVGRSQAMQNIYKEIGRVAARPVDVLIRGETGTGKELIARALYQHSDRAPAPFITINCAAIPETLLESELFGHERGAFTGADARRIGRFEQAGGGTIFLDEIGDMTLGTQVKLLRVLQERTLRRLGGKEIIPVDVRVIAATHRDLEAAMAAGTFRQDLFYRLNVVVLTLPALRHRREDIPELVRYFLARHGPALGTAAPSIHPEAMTCLQQQNWPGNVRELENVVRKALLAAQGYTISPDHVRATLAANTGGPALLKPSLGEWLDQVLDAAQRGESTGVHAQVTGAVERELFARAIRRAGGNQARAARWLGITRITMHAKLVQFGLHPAAGRAPGQDGI